MTSDASRICLHGPPDDTPGIQVKDGSDVEPAFCRPDIGEPKVRAANSASHFWFGRSAWKSRSSLAGSFEPVAVTGSMSAMTERSPSSFGFPRRLGRARKALIRISRSIKVEARRPVLPPGSSHWAPLVQAQWRGRQTRRAPQVRSLALKLVSIAVTSLASWISWVLVGRLSQAWKPDRDTASTSHSQLTGQMWRCLAMKANLMSIRLIARTNGAISLKRARKKPPSSRHVALRTKTRDLFLQGCNLGEVGPHLPVPGKRRGWCRGQFPHPAAQNAFCHIKVTRGLRHRDTTLRHQPYGLDLELTAELPSRHSHSPVPWSRSYLRVHETGSRPARASPKWVFAAVTKVKTGSFFRATSHLLANRFRPARWRR